MRSGARLRARVIERMQRETDTARRSRIHGFPQQFAGLEPALARFLGDTFHGTRFEASPLLRGVYFTSGTQHGRPIDRAISALAQSLGEGATPLRRATPPAARISSNGC